LFLQSFVGQSIHSGIKVVELGKHANREMPLTQLLQFHVKFMYMSC